MRARPLAQIRAHMLGQILSVTLAVLASPAPAQDIEAGQALYLDFCAACHGLQARGDGAMADLLRVVPTDLTGLGAGDAFPILRVA